MGKLAAWQKQEQDLMARLHKPDGGRRIPPKLTEDTAE
jgi:hypothetical protein